MAEGIETEEIAARLKGLACQSGQGYLWSRPKPAAAIVAAIREQDAEFAPAVIAG